MSLGVYLCPKCSEPLEKPEDDRSELVCPGCATSFTDPELKRLKFAPEGSAVDSPGMVYGLGTNPRKTLDSFHQLGVKARQAQPDRFTGEGFMLSLHDLWDGHKDGFWIRLTQRLKDRGLSPEKIALVSAAIRQEIKHLDRKRSKELADILRRFGIE